MKFTLNVYFRCSKLPMVLGEQVEIFHTECCSNECVFLHLCFLFPRVERKERARLKTVKFNAKPGVIDAKGVCRY